MRPRLRPYQIDDLRNLEQAFETHRAAARLRAGLGLAHDWQDIRSSLAKLEALA